MTKRQRQKHQQQIDIQFHPSHSPLHPFQVEDSLFQIRLMMPSTSRKVSRSKAWVGTETYVLVLSQQGHQMLLEPLLLIGQPAGSTTSLNISQLLLLIYAAWVSPYFS